MARDSAARTAALVAVLGVVFFTLGASLLVTLARQHAQVLVQTAQDGSDLQAKEQPVKRISIFDQWTAPNKTAEEDFVTSNPSYAYVKAYVTTGRRFDALVNSQMTSHCKAKCQPRPGYNPSKEVVASCLKFCQRLSDDTDPVVATPQPATRSWWRRKTGKDLVKDGRYVHYVANPFGGGEDTGARIPDPYSDRPMGNTIANLPNDAIPGMPVPATATATASLSTPALASTPTTASLQDYGDSPDALDQDGPPLDLNRATKSMPAHLQTQTQTPQQLLLTGLASVDGQGTHGLDAVHFTKISALKDLDSYFDTLPTKDCNEPTCNYVDTRTVKGPRKLVHKGSKFSTKDIRRLERRMLGYHRQHEDAMTADEMRKIGAESDRLVSGSVGGYMSLERQAQLGGGRRAAHSRPAVLHSAAYEEAGKTKGFAGYYSNVFVHALGGGAERGEVERKGGRMDEERNEEKRMERRRAPGFDRYADGAGAGAGAVRERAGMQMRARGVKTRRVQQRLRSGIVHEVSAQLLGARAVLGSAERKIEALEERKEGLERENAGLARAMGREAKEKTALASSVALRMSELRAKKMELERENAELLRTLAREGAQQHAHAHASTAGTQASTEARTEHAGSDALARSRKEEGTGAARTRAAAGQQPSHAPASTASTATRTGKVGSEAAAHAGTAALVGESASKVVGRGEVRVKGAKTQEKMQAHGGTKERVGSSETRVRVGGGAARVVVKGGHSQPVEGEKKSRPEVRTEPKALKSRRKSEALEGTEKRVGVAKDRARVGLGAKVAAKGDDAHKGATTGQDSVLPLQGVKRTESQLRTEVKELEAFQRAQSEGALAALN
jgi:hypothetical protein